MQPAAVIERLEARIPQLLDALPWVLAIILGVFFLNLLVGRALQLLARRTQLTPADLQPFRSLLKWVTRLLAFVLILSVFGFQLGGLWAMVSTVFGLVAIGFVAVWSILSHTSATMLILFLHPFQMGDDLEFPGEPVRGRAVDLNFFFTTLVDHDGTLYQIPNNLFFQKTFKRRKNRRIVSLAAQLNSSVPVEVELPPAPRAASGGKVKPPDPMMNYPDPKSYSPPTRK